MKIEQILAHSGKQDSLSKDCLSQFWIKGLSEIFQKWFVIKHHLK